MNLAEFPLAVLSTRGNTQTKTLEFSDTVKSKNGEPVVRSWIITGADKFGLPTSSDDEVLLGLLKLTVDQSLNDRKIFFTRYELMKSLRWPTEGRNYIRLQKALDRLSGVRIKATNAFYDNVSKSHSTKNFGIIDEYEINSSSDKKSFFVWSDILFQSFQAGFIKKLDLDFYLNLESAVSKRLYRYLDKHFWYKNSIKVNVFILAHEKIGVSRNFKYLSSIRQQLDPALEELRDRGFIDKFIYEGKGANSEITIYAKINGAINSAGIKDTQQEQISNSNSNTSVFESKKPETQKLKTTTKSANSKEAKSSLNNLSGTLSKITSEISPTESNFTNVELSNDGNSKLLESEKQPSLSRQLMGAMEKRGLQEHQIRALLKEKNENQLKRIKLIIDYFDYLKKINSKNLNKNPIGFLYRAIQNFEEFKLPEFYEKTLAKSTQIVNTRAVNTQTLFSQNTNSKAEQKPVSNIDKLQAQYLIYRNQEISKAKKTLDRETLKTIREGVIKALDKLKSLLTESRFAEVVEHGVDEKIAKLCMLKSFEQWKGE